MDWFRSQVSALSTLRGDDAREILLLRKKEMGKLRIQKKGTFEILVECSWITDLNYEAHISISVTEYGVNVAATGTLNLSGIAALEAVG